MPAMRPIQFSALKALDPLDEEEERGEHHDGQPDVDEVEHGALLGVSQGRGAARSCAAQTAVNPQKPGQGRAHARSMRAWSDP